MPGCLRPIERILRRLGPARAAPVGKSDPGTPQGPRSAGRSGDGGHTPRGADGGPTPASRPRSRRSRRRRTSGRGSAAAQRERNCTRAPSGFPAGSIAARRAGTALSPSVICARCIVQLPSRSSAISASSMSVPRASRSGVIPRCRYRSGVRLGGRSVGTAFWMAWQGSLPSSQTRVRGHWLCRLRCPAMNHPRRHGSRAPASISVDRSGSRPAWGEALRAAQAAPDPARPTAASAWQSGTPWPRPQRIPAPVPAGPAAQCRMSLPPHHLPRTENDHARGTGGCSCPEDGVAGRKLHVPDGSRMAADSSSGK